VGSCHGCVKPKTIELVVAIFDEQAVMQDGVKATIGWLGKWGIIS